MNDSGTTIVGLGSAGAAILAAAENIGQGRILVDTHKSVGKYSVDHLLIGEKLLRGCGASRSYRLGCRAIEESFDQIYAKIKQSKYIWIISGIAGGTGGASIYLADKLLRRNIKVGLLLIMPLRAEKNTSASDEATQLLDKIRGELLACKNIDDEALWDSKTNVSLVEYLKQYQSYIHNQLIIELDKAY